MSIKVKRSRRAAKKRWDFNKPEDFPYEVRAHVVAIKETRELIGKFEILFSGIQSFDVLIERMNSIKFYMDEAVNHIKDYLDEDSDFDFESFEVIMNDDMAGWIEEDLDLYPSFNYTENPSQTVDQLESDIDEVIQRVWIEVREKGYNIHTAMIRA